MTDDNEFLRRYAEEESQEAFTEFVHRHAGLVYAAAMRQLFDAHLAEDVVQAVFIDAAKKAAELRSHPAPAAWLFTSTHYAAAHALRREGRRKSRELAAIAMNPENSAGDREWLEIRPLLDEVMHELPSIERTAIVLSYFYQLRPFEVRSGWL